MEDSSLLELHKALATHAKETGTRGKGPLSVALILTRRAAQMNPPFDENDFLTPRKGQVAGLSGASVASILKGHGINRTLSEEGGRTSRGSIDRMRRYVAFLNKLHARGILHFEEIEKWWIGEVRRFFDSMPLRLKLDSSKSLRTLVSELIAAAFARQRDQGGTMVVGAVLQHLVGAKLEIILPPGTVEHNGFSVADAPAGRSGDFRIFDSAIHVTTAPSEALLRKCNDNLQDGLRPLIITTEKGVSGALAIAENYGQGLQERVEVLDIQQFITTNVYEWSRFSSGCRTSSIRDLVDTYNRIIESTETDHSLRIELG
ncbi:MAG: DUF4928 family protein [Opitutales bacterium]|nr:DUF4928 family protein [Opitutales bacterium]